MLGRFPNSLLILLLCFDFVSNALGFYLVFYGMGVR